MAYLNFSIFLQEQGRLDESLVAVRRAFEVARSNSKSLWGLSGRIRRIEQLIALEKRWPRFINGEDRPQGLTEYVGFARIAYNHKRFALAARLWAAAFEFDPKQQSNRREGDAYSAARAAVLAASGQGKDAPASEELKAGLRSLAMGWLQQELRVFSAVVAQRPQESRSAVARTLERWKLDPALAAVRDADALAKLPEAERQGWRAFWADVIRGPRVPKEVGQFVTGGMPSVVGQAPGLQAPAVGEARVGGRQHSPGEVRRFDGHENQIWGVAISRDGRRLLTASHDCTARYWDVDTGRLLKVLRGHESHVKDVAFLPDGRRGISGADDDTMRLWDLETGRELRLFLGHTSDIWTVAVSPDGRRALSGGQDNTVRLWDLETGRELRRLDGHSKPVTKVVFLPDGRRALSASQDGTVRMWDLETGRELRRLDGGPGVLICVAVSPDGRLILAGGDDGIVRVWELESGREVGRLTKHDDGVIGLGFMPDSRLAVSGGLGKDRTLKVWNLDTGQEVQTLRGFIGAARIFAVTSDGRSVVLAVGGNTAQLWALPDLDESQVLVGSSRLPGIARA